MKLLRDYRIRLDKQRTAYGLGWVDTNRLFVQESGKPMHPDTPSSWFPKFLRKNELSEIRFHDLRHIHGSILLAMGMDMNSVADQMGHADTQMLIKTYGHNVRKKPREVAEHLVKALINKDSDEMAE
jgi:integrase